MAALVAPGVVRYTVHGTYATRPVANVLDFLLVPTAPATRAVDISELAEFVVQEWIDEILANLVDNYTATEISWVDLDTEDGTVGAATAGITANFPSSGIGATPAMPGNVAYRVDKRVAAQRGQRQGRMYLVGVPESVTADATPNTVDAASIASINANLADFLDGVNLTAGETSGWQSTLVVVHTKNLTEPPAEPDIVFDGTSTVNTLTLDSMLGSQRRRLRS